MLGAFDAVVTLEGEDEKAIEEAVAGISKTRGVKEAKPLVEVKASVQNDLKPVLGAAPSASWSRASPTA